jgi:DNA-binding SARP family transcriptional activator
VACLSFTLLGGFQARLASGKPLTLPRKKTQALLAYLALHPGQAHSRDKLAALLWGERGEEQARNSLRQALFALREALPATRPPALVTQGETVALDPAAVDSDVAAFERLLDDRTPNALARAAALYGGDLLDGFSLKEVAFEEWLSGERERLRQQAVEALGQLLASQEKTAAAEPAIRTAIRLLAVEPVQEPVHRTLMRLYARQGRWGAALRQYHLCVDLLRRELGVEPEGETQRLYQAILQQRAPTPDARRAPKSRPPRRELRQVSLEPAPLDPMLVARDRELAQLRRGADLARGGHGQIMMILGEAGIGKTRLIAELATEARDRSLVLLGHCYESEQILPFGPWADAVRAGPVLKDGEMLAGLAPAWRLELARLFPELMPAGLPAPADAADQLRLFEAVAQLVAHLASRQPLVLILEDLHWADDMSLRLLSFVGRRLRAWPVLIIGTARDEELPGLPALRHALQELRRDGRLAEMALSPLSRPDTLTLVRALDGGRLDESALVRLAEQLWVASEGNPFMVVESMRARQEGTVSEQQRTLRLPRRVHDVIAGRLERLSERSRWLVAVASVIGREFDFALLERAAGLGECDTAEELEELARRRVIRGSGDRFDFAHDRFREMAYGQLLPARRRLIHRQVARALEALHAGDLTAQYSTLGYHCRQAEDWEHAVRYLRHAGVEAAKRAAHRDATTSFEQALEVLEHLPESQGTLTQALELRFDLRSSLFLLGEHDRIFAHLRRAETLAQRLRDRRGLARVLALMASHLWRAGDHPGALEAGQRARAIASELQDLPLRILAMFHLAQTWYALGDYRAAVEDLSTNVAALTGDLASAHLGLPGPMSIVCRTYLAWALAELSAFEEAHVRSDEAVRMAVALDRPTGLIDAHLALGVVHLLQGDLEHAASALRDGLAVSDLGDHAIIQQASRACLAYVQALTGQTSEAISSLERIVAQASTMRNVGPARVITYLGEAYLLGDRPSDAARQASAAVALARERRERGYEAWALRLLGEVTSQPGHCDQPTADAHYRAAMALAADLGMRPLVAHCHLGLAKLCRRTGDGAKAQEHLTIATTMYREMGMGFWLEKAEAAWGALR